MRYLLPLIGSSMLAIASAAQAQARNDAAPAPATAAQEQAEAQNAKDIVVTANRREERLTDVPVTVSVVSGEQLTRQNINAVEDLSRSAPALNTAGPAGFGALSIRGIGGLSFSRSSEGSVGVVVDGVSLANTSTSPPLLFDIAQVEVLEGPQGTLFGRNSSAGVVNIITNAPNPSGFEMIANADIGSRNNYIGRAAINIPVSANAALRVAGSFTQAPQVQRNLEDGSYLRRQAIATRARFLWEPSDTVTINLAADYNDSDSDGGVPWAVYSSSSTSLLTARLAACGVEVGPRNDEGCINSGSKQSTSTYGFSGQIDVDLGGPILTSITAYRAANGDSSNDVDSTNANRLTQTVSDEIRNFSQELRLSSPSGGTVEYVAGLYYFQSDLDNRTTQLGELLADLPLIGACPLTPTFLCGLPVGSTRPINTKIESFAAFGQVTVRVTEALRFILGGRLGRENVSALSGASVVSPGAAFEFAPALQLNNSVSDTYFSYRIGAQYDVSDDVMAFATYTRGYKGPAINDGAASAAVPLLVEAEIPKSGEIGVRATVANGRGVLSATAFYTEVTNFQDQFFDSSIPAFIFGNAPSLTSKGVSASLFGRLAKGLTANLGVTYTDATYGPDYFVADFTNAVVSAEGNRLVGAPRWKATLSAEYTTALSESLNGFVQGDIVYRSGTFSNAANDAILSTEGAAIFGGRIGVRTDDDRLGVSIFARNIFDTFRPTARFATPTAAQQLDPLSFSQFAGPESHRVIGLSLDSRF
ncbi:MAG: TonB-dependent receptor [Porphyrobacter sp.]|jgi:iron complex outermembrane receptor protein|nr:TonB-dependent receptor [Porphyrobacter sp.]